MTSNESTIEPLSRNAPSSSDIAIQKSPESRIREADLDNPGFGTLFSDHMFSMEYRDGAWRDPGVIPFGDVTCSPAMATLHYGQAIFEGMKAFADEDGAVRIFRPKEHLERLNRSCRRMSIPEVDTTLLLKGLKTLLKTDRNWVPRKQGNALYLRPFLFATDPYLGVRPSQTYRLLIITSPVGAYYKEGINPVNLTTSDRYVRAVKGGSGEIKTACNYGPTLLPAQEAQQNGYTQILWLDAREHRYIEEVGTMNIFFVMDGKLVTPEANGSILPGITRQSVLDLAARLGLECRERPITIAQLFEAYRNGALTEIFGTGTAAVISPVGSIHHQGETLVTNREQIGPVARMLYDTITGIQYGREEDTFGWMERIN